ncbi:MAG: DUF423 domain-containing protein [Parvularculaceae bacterium]
MDRLAFAAGLAGFLSVALGAFGAHGLEDRLTPRGAELWDTATTYALAHAVAALAASRAGWRAAGGAFLAGAVLFAGSLYALALGAPSTLGAVTPLGGLAFLAGWLLVMREALSRDQRRDKA